MEKRPEDFFHGLFFHGLLDGRAASPLRRTLRVRAGAGGSAAGLQHRLEKLVHGSGEPGIGAEFLSETHEHERLDQGVPIDGGDLERLHGALRDDHSFDAGGRVGGMSPARRQRQRYGRAPARGKSPPSDGGGAAAAVGGQLAPAGMVREGSPTRQPPRVASLESPETVSGAGTPPSTSCEPPGPEKTGDTDHQKKNGTKKKRTRGPKTTGPVAALEVWVLGGGNGR